MKIAPEIALLLDALDEAFDHKSWHGPNLRGAVRLVSAEEAAWRPGTGRHNIRELVVHCAYWKYAVRRMLTGGKRGSFAMEGSNWFAREGGDAAAWKSEVKLLAEEHRQLREVVSKLRPADLTRKPKGSKYTTAAIVRGIAAHDLYHAGQIQLLKRLQRS